MPKIPGTTAVAKTAQKSIQKWLGKGSKEILEHVATEAPDLYKATAKSTLDGFGYAIDSKLVEPEDAVNIFKNGDVEGLQNFSAQGTDAMRQSQMAEQLNPSKPTALPEPEAPPVHNITSADQATWTKDTLGKWLVDNEARLRNKEISAADNFGEIIVDNQRKRVSTASIDTFLDDPAKNVKHLKLKKATLGEKATRDVQADFANAEVAVRSLETANQAWKQGAKTATGKRAGVNPEWLNPDSMRKGTMRGANYAREIIRKIRKLKGFEDFDVQQGHAIDLSANKGVDAMPTFMAEPGIGNRASNRKSVGGTAFDEGSMEALGQASGAKFKEAEAIKGTGPLSTQRREEYKQFGWLQEVWNQALIAKETKGMGMKEANAILKEQRDALVKGDLLGLQGFKFPGSKVTLDDMLVIQQKALKTGDAASAAEEVIAQRELFEWAQANGLTDNPDTLKILKQKMKDIDTRIRVEDAAAKGAPKGGYRFSGMTPDEIKEAMPGRFIKLDRAGNVIPPKELTEISPGVMVGPNYKPGADQALDNVLKKLAADPTSLDTSGMGQRVGGELQNIVND